MKSYFLKKILNNLILLLALISFTNCSNSLKILFEDPTLRDSLTPVITMTNVSIVSDNADPTTSVMGDTITLTFTATYVVQSGDPIGIVPFNISGINGLLGDIGVDVSSTTDYSSVYNGPNPPAWELEVTTTAPSQNMTVYLNAPSRIVIDWGGKVDRYFVSSPGDYRYNIF